tara:strand:- start:380 stop:3412 length:3033 start_codon:yes stop_codon:yes gene_type:complete
MSRAAHKLLAASGGEDAYEIETSLRFDRDDDAYLKRTPSSAGNLRTWTLSWWMKRCDAESGSIAQSQIIFGVGDLGASATPHSHNIYFRGDSSDRFSFEQWSGSGTTSYGGTTRREFVDLSAWYHFVLIQDSTDGTAGDRFKIYVNGVRETDIPWGNALTSNWDGLINTTTAHFIGGSDPAGDNRHSDMYLAEMHFIDGTAKAVGDFGETNSVTNQWVPKEYTGGSYGTNGFYLPFKKNDRYSVYFDGSTSTGIEVNDSSDFDMGDGDMTCEMWFYVDEDAGNYRRLCGQSNSGGTQAQIPFAIEIDTNNKPVGYLFYNGANYVTLLSSTAINDNEWNHVALVRDNGTATLYLNGSSVVSQSTTVTLNTSSGKFGIGQLGEYTGDTFKGWISNFRLVVGSAVYTSNFTPSTSPLTAVTNTEILCCQDSTATTDNSGNSRTLTVTAANTYTQKMAPFTYDWYQDHSGQDNDWTPDNLTVNDIVTDTPTNNHCTVNYNESSGNLTLKHGNLKLHSSDSNRVCIRGSQGVNSGKWYFEYTVGSSSGGSVGVNSAVSALTSNGMVGNSSFGWAVNSDGAKENGNSETAGYMSSGYTTNDVIGVALNMDDAEITFYKNGTSSGVAFTNLAGRGPLFPAVCTASASGSFDTLNFGQMDFEHTPPSGYKAWNTSNLPNPTIKKPTEHFNSVTYTGSDDDSVSQSVTGVGFEPDLVIIKRRDATASPAWWDQVRGEHKGLNSDATDEEKTDTYGLETFDSDGFTVRESDTAQGKTNTGTLVAWNWKANGSGSSNTDGSETTTVSANTDAGFSIVTGTGTGSSTSYGHGLGVEPKVVITKRRDSTSNWSFYTSGIDGYPYNTWQYAYLDTTDDFDPASEIASNTTTFSVNITDDATFVAYVFAEVEGFSKFSIYEGNGSTTGPFINCGFTPAWLMTKRAGGSGGEEWSVWDNKRDPDNPILLEMQMSSTIADYSHEFFNWHSNGFQLKTSSDGGSFNGSGQIIFYMAFAESPFKYSNAR